MNATLIHVHRYNILRYSMFCLTYSYLVLEDKFHKMLNTDLIRAGFFQSVFQKIRAEVRFHHVMFVLGL